MTNIRPRSVLLLLATAATLGFLVSEMLGPRPAEAQIGGTAVQERIVGYALTPPYAFTLRQRTDGVLRQCANNFETGKPAGCVTLQAQ